MSDVDKTAGRTVSVPQSHDKGGSGVTDMADMRFIASGLTKRYRGMTRDVVSGMDFSIAKGGTLGIFGPSGSGKSTIGQMAAGILKSDSGKMYYARDDGQPELITWPFKGAVRKGIQILFQHPEVSFDPKMSLYKSMQEPYRFHGKTFCEDALLEFLAEFGIYREHLLRYPAELSGGELQRLALARVMLADPGLVVLDEPTSMLDVISQAQVVRLLKERQERSRISYLFISHDRKLCEWFCDEIIEL